MPDRKGRLTPDEIREAADRAMGLSGGAGMPSKQQINRSLKMMRSPMPAYQEGGVTGSDLPAATELESVEVVPGGEPRSEEDIRREVMMELQRDNPDMEPRMGSYVQDSTDAELMQAMDPGELPNQQSRGMDQLNEQELMLSRDIAARKISQATSRMAEQGISRDASMQAQMDRQQATDELQRIMDEMSRRGMYDGLFDEPATLRRMAMEREFLESLRRGTGGMEAADELMSPAPAAGGGDTSRFMERDPIMAYRGGGMAGMKKHMGAYGHGGMGGMGAYEKGGMTGKFDDHPALKGKQKTNIPDSLQEAIINKSGMKARAGGGMVGMKRMPAYEEGGMTGSKKK